MKKHELILLAVFIAVLILVIYYFLRQSPFRFNQEPEWVKEIRAKVDLEKCSSSNCEACDKEKCSLYSELCKLNYRGYACGPSCDAVLTFCTAK